MNVMSEQVQNYLQFYIAGQEYARVWKDLTSNLETQTDAAIEAAAMLEIGINDIADDESDMMIAAFRAGFDSIQLQV